MTNSHELNTLSTPYALNQQLVIQVLRMPLLPKSQRRHFHVSFSLNDDTSGVPLLEEHVLHPLLVVVSVIGFWWLQSHHQVLPPP
jgi:hypothetical protein